MDDFRGYAIEDVGGCGWRFFLHKGVEPWAVVSVKPVSLKSENLRMNEEIN